MKKSSLTAALVASMAGVAGLVSVSNAMNMNPDGLGQVLIYPYYTVNGGNQTLISVVNTTDQVKAVKVRFLEGRNSQEVLDFNLYLSPFDVWTGAIDGEDEGADPINAGPGVLTTDDTSCTVPAIPEAGQPFVNFQYAATNDDGGPYQNSRTREGHIEMIEMGELFDEGTSASAFKPATWATHTSAGIPDDCEAIVAAWDGGEWDADSGRAVSTPMGGLFGGAEIVDIANGTNISYNADAVEGFFVDLVLPRDEDLHYGPENILPNFTDGRSDNLGNVFAAVVDSGTIVQFDFDDADFGAPGLRGVSALFMHNEIYNEYVAQAGFASEWVVTFPTKQLHLQVDNFVSGWGNDEQEPFTRDYVVRTDGDGNPLSDSPVGACENIQFTYWDREERTPQGGGVNFSPRPPNALGPQLCYEAQVISFSQSNVSDVYYGGNQSDVLGSYFARNFALNFSAGWGRLELGTDASGNVVNRMIDSNGAQLFGLPVTGFWASKVTLESGGSALANFSIVHKHRADRFYSTSTP